MRKRNTLLVLGLLLALIAAACGGSGSTETTAGEEPTTTAESGTETTAAEEEATTTTAAAEPVELVAVAGSSVDFISLVPLAAWDILAEEGITVEQKYLEEAPTAIQAMTQGEAQIGTNIGVNVGVPAVDAGAALVDVVATQRPTWALAVAPDINSFEDLEGKRIAVHGEASFTRAVSQFFAEQHGFTYEELIIPGSEVRAEALAQGQIDASVIDLPDVIQLAATYPGSFKVLSTIGEQFPELIEQDLWLSRDWAEANPELATRVVQAIVEAMRRLTADADYAVALATENLPDMDVAVLEELVAEYAARDIWPADGLMTAERAYDTLVFFQSVGEIDLGELTEESVSKYFDFTYLETALQNLDG
ncbi:MAG: ABC transporter substrate-binding protein [Acidimicrobiia bacterium]